MKFITAGQRHQGRYRQHNEDSFLVSDELGLYAVADGVESEPFGEKASQMAVQLLAESLQSVSLESDATPPFDYAEGMPLPVRAVKFAFRETNRRIFEAAQADARFTGMSTTLSVLWFQGQKIYIGSVGDSRAYMVRKGRIHQLTHDHTSLAQGSSQKPVEIEFMETYSSQPEHELTRAMGLNPDVEVQLAGGTPVPEDIFVLATDGLYGGLRDFEIQDTVKSFPPAEATRELIALANKRGGRDNMAVVVIQVK